MLNKLFSLIGKSISPSGGGVVPACTQFVYNTGFPPYGTYVRTDTHSSYLTWYWSSNSNLTTEFEWGTHSNDVFADGSGGLFSGDAYNFVDNTTYNSVIKDDLDYSQYTRIIYKGSGSWSECTRFGATGNTSVGTVYININGLDCLGGSYTYTEYYDGVCGIFNEQTTYWYPYGTSLFSDGSYNYYCDGTGGYYTEAYSPTYPPFGEFLYGEGGSSDLTWNAPDGQSGTWTYASWGCSYYADGNNGTYSNCGGYTQSYGTQITSGYYSVDMGTDEWGNTQYQTSYYTIYFDGNSGYYTNTST